MLDCFAAILLELVRSALRAFILVVLLVILFGVVSYGAWYGIGPGTFPLYGLASVAIVLVFCGAVF